MRFHVLLFLGILMFGAANASICYQETATTATSCGGLATGSYLVDGWTYNNGGGEAAANLNDTDWNTAGAVYLNTGVNVPPHYEYFYSNYTKPANTANATLQMKAGCGSYGTLANYTIPSTCLSQSTLQFRGKTLEQYEGGIMIWLQGFWYECNNGTDWLPIHEFCFNNGDEEPQELYAFIAEEAMWWEISNETGPTAAQLAVNVVLGLGAIAAVVVLISLIFSGETTIESLIMFLVIAIITITAIIPALLKEVF